MFDVAKFLQYFVVVIVIDKDASIHEHDWKKCDRNFHNTFSFDALCSHDKAFRYVPFTRDKQTVQRKEKSFRKSIQTHDKSEHMHVTGASYSIWFSLILLCHAPCAFSVCFFILKTLQSDDKRTGEATFFTMLETLLPELNTPVIFSFQESYPSSERLKPRTNDKHVRYDKQLNPILHQSNLISFNLAWVNCLLFFFFFPCTEQTELQREKKIINEIILNLFVYTLECPSMCIRFRNSLSTKLYPQTLKRNSIWWTTFRQCIPNVKLQYHI